MWAKNSWQCLLLKNSLLSFPYAATPSTQSLYIVIPVTVIASCLILIPINILLVLLVVFCKRKKARLQPCLHDNDAEVRINNSHHTNGNGVDMSFLQAPPPYSSTSIEHVHVSVTDETSMSFTSGSGAGKPFLVRRTIARSITLGESIGGGRFGQVYVGYYQGERYAVKKFFSKDEQSWFHESDIYNSVNLRHDNVLTCFATDMLSNNGVTELWLITQYHPRGSLFEELNRGGLTLDTTLKFIHSTCRGLAYLHLEVTGTQGKPSVAHRDLKSKNILVKNDSTCCIADFGLAVVKNNSLIFNNKLENVQQGTKRYMPPEVLSGTIDVQSFESFMRSDLYSFGLVMWEVCRRCQIESMLLCFWCF